MHYEYISYYLATSWLLTYLVGQLLLLATVGQLLSTYLSTTYRNIHTYLCVCVWVKNNANYMCALKCKCCGTLRSYLCKHIGMYVRMWVNFLHATPLHILWHLLPAKRKWIWLAASLAQLKEEVYKAPLTQIYKHSLCRGLRQYVCIAIQCVRMKWG